ncbi:MAG: hypothetical protein P1V51_03380 [Deltaproteobacteria bacterium]|nr:hypothetical protein [Deltaproteobacteria bacterium]
MRHLAFAVIVTCTLLVAGCGGGGGGGDEDGGDCVPTAICRTGEVKVEGACADCRTADDGCGGVLQCGPDPTCVTPCPEGEYQVFGACTDAETCLERTACGQSVICRSVEVCLGEESCPDGGFLLDACNGLPNCLPYNVCGVVRYCPTLSGCEQQACSEGESPTVLACSDPSIELPCREVSACATTVSCVCAAAANQCRLDEYFDTSPCTPGEECRELVVCGQTIYCKGQSV